MEMDLRGSSQKAATFPSWIDQLKKERSIPPQDQRERRDLAGAAGQCGPPHLSGKREAFVWKPSTAYYDNSLWLFSIFLLSN